MGIAEFKKMLGHLDQKQMRELLLELYKKNKSAKEFLEVHFQPNDRSLFDAYRDKVYESYYPKRGYKYKLAQAKRALAEFKKLEPAQVQYADLCLFYVEISVKFSSDRGIRNEAFYAGIVSVFLTSMRLMKSLDELDHFKYRAELLVNTAHRLDLSLHMQLIEILDAFYTSF
ncbi:MAG: DUF6155 family protein [Saprospiraceae bacterium]